MQAPAKGLCPLMCPPRGEIFQSVSPLQNVCWEGILSLVMHSCCSLHGLGMGLPTATSGHRNAHRSPAWWCVLRANQHSPASVGFAGFPRPQHCLLCTPTPARHGKKTTAKGKETPEIKTQEKALIQIVGLPCCAVLITSAHLL